jgi:propionyl-CoA carboxylase alpha chain
VTAVFTRVLVANRGEIARRIFRSCRDLGLSSVAVYSDADSGSPHVAEADLAVRLPGSAPADTYASGAALIEAAGRSGADAVHPGYGFLAENAEFAGAVQAAGLTWIGPPPAVIEGMASKLEAKRLMAAAGVPVLPSLEPAAVAAADLPVLIKASAGGGGRGMRIAATLAELPGELAAARAEAAAAFGDPAVYCEPYLSPGRHLEVQVLADRHGTVWTIGERECSIQRRYQKIIEETPSPLAERTPGLRQRLLRAAGAAAGAVGYVSAGTAEFLADESGRCYFLEMNTRLQVEHPVTEAVTGLDLVALQLQIAAGHRLPAEPPAAAGHAIEARLYAEDPAAGWQPQTGTVHRFEVPAATVQFAASNPGAARFPAGPAPVPAVRLDSGVVAGCLVGADYDPMLAKVICWAPERGQAAAVLAGALAGAKIHGLRTNRDLLVRALRHPAFLAGDTDTGFLARHGLAALAAPLSGPEARELSALAAALADAAARQQAARRGGAPVLGALPSGWRNVPSQLQRKHYAGHEVGYRFDRSGLTTEGMDNIELISLTPERVVLEAGGVRVAFDVAAYPGLVCVDSPLGPVTLTPVSAFAEPGAAGPAGSLLAPMPGTVARLGAAVGDAVRAGQPLLWLEAMKMQHVIAAPAAGVVVELPVAVGQQVEVGAVLAVVKSGEDG